MSPICILPPRPLEYPSSRPMHSHSSSIKIGAFGDQMAGAAMIAGDQIRRLQRRTNTDGNRLLAAVGMGAAEHRLALVELFQFFLESPHQNHLAQHLFSFRRI